MNNWYKNANLDWSPNSLRLSVTPSFTAKEMYYYVQEVGHLHTYSHYFTERENLESFLIVYTVKGSGQLTYLGENYLLTEGQAFFIDCREYQYYRASSSQSWEIYFIHFKGGNSFDYYQKFIKLNGPVIYLTDDGTLPECMEKIIVLHQHKDIRTEVICSKYITDMLTIILSNSIKPNTDSFYIPDYIQKIKDYIEQNFTGKITLDTLSYKFSISKYHLAREFKKYTGISPYEFQFTIRINTAKELLKYSDLSIEEISYEIGISQVSHFIRLFREKEEMTPLQFKKIWQRGRR